MSLFADSYTGLVVCPGTARARINAVVAVHDRGAVDPGAGVGRLGPCSRGRETYLSRRELELALTW